MPELPEVETLVRELDKALRGRVIQGVSVGHESILKTSSLVLKKNLPGQRIIKVDRIAKYIRIELSEGALLWIHLGMTGQIFFEKPPARLLSHTHFVLSFENSDRQLFFRDTRRFGRIALSRKEKETLPCGVGRLGLEPKEWDPAAFASAFKERRGRIKNLLLNQNLIAGLGNIYADESLHRAGLHPLKRAHRLPRRRLFRLHEAICEVLEEAIRQGGSSVSDYRRLDGSRGEFQKFHRVYGRRGEKCSTCSSPIQRIQLSGRSASFCPQCQPS